MKLNQGWCGRQRTARRREQSTWITPTSGRSIRDHPGSNQLSVWGYPAIVTPSLTGLSHKPGTRKVYPVRSSLYGEKSGPASPVVWPPLLCLERAFLKTFGVPPLGDPKDDESWHDRHDIERCNARPQ